MHCSSTEESPAAHARTFEYDLETPLLRTKIQAHSLSNLSCCLCYTLITHPSVLLLQALEESEGVAEKHEAAAQEGQTDATEHSKNVNAHFICITSCEGHLFELDGRKGIPVNHGPTAPGACGCHAPTRPQRVLR